MAMDLRSGIIAAARRLGMDPVDLATIISYETGGSMDPTQAGPTTKWGQHRGLIQFGEPQAEQYGVDWNDPLGSQLGEEGAIVKYFEGSGWRPGMDFRNAYSIVNAGGPGRFTASDEAAGGAPGDVNAKVDSTAMQAHRAKASEMIGGANQYALANDPRRDTPSSGRPVGSELPGPVYPQGTTDYSNPISGYGGGPQGPGAPADGKYKPPEESGWEKFKNNLGESFGDMAGMSSSMPAAAPAAAAPPPGLAPTAGVSYGDDEEKAMRRQRLAEVMAKLNSGASGMPKLWG